jgi:hypothetical protein
MSLNSLVIPQESFSNSDKPVIGRVYKLVNSEDDTYYFGSTIHSLEDRLKEHIAFANTSKKLSKLQTHFNKIGWDKVSIELVLETPIKFDYELRIHENKYICNHLIYINCLNSKLSYYYRHLNLSKSQFLETPAEKIIQMEHDYNVKVYTEMFNRKNNISENLEKNPEFAKKYEDRLQSYLTKINPDILTQIKNDSERLEKKVKKIPEKVVKKVVEKVPQKVIQKVPEKVVEKISESILDNKTKNIKNSKIINTESDKNNTSILEFLHKFSDNSENS